MANIFSDNFNRVDSPTLGSNWTPVTGTFEIVSNQAKLTVNPSEGLAKHSAANYSTADYTVESVVNTDTFGGAAGVAGRINGTSYYGVIAGAGFLRLNRYPGLNQLGYATTSTTGQRTLKLKMEGSAIKAFIDGIELISATDTVITGAGVAGLTTLGAVGASLALWDNFTVDDLFVPFPDELIQSRRMIDDP